LIFNARVTDRHTVLRKVARWFVIGTVTGQLINWIQERQIAEWFLVAPELDTPLEWRLVYCFSSRLLIIFLESGIVIS